MFLSTYARHTHTHSREMSSEHVYVWRDDRRMTRFFAYHRHRARTFDFIEWKTNFTSPRKSAAQIDRLATAGCCVCRAQKMKYANTAGGIPLHSRCELKYFMCDDLNEINPKHIIHPARYPVQMCVKYFCWFFPNEILFFIFVVAVAKNHHRTGAGFSLFLCSTHSRAQSVSISLSQHIKFDFRFWNYYFQPVSRTFMQSRIILLPFVCASPDFAPHKHFILHSTAHWCTKIAAPFRLCTGTVFGHHPNALRFFASCASSQAAEDSFLSCIALNMNRSDIRHFN